MKSIKLIIYMSKILILTNIFVINFLCLGYSHTNAEETLIKIDYPMSGLRTRRSDVIVKGTLSATNITSVKVTLDGSTVGEFSVPVENMEFETTITIGSGKSSINASTKTSSGRNIETGIVIYRDCTVTTIAGSGTAYVNQTEQMVTNPVQIKGNRTLVAVREFAQFFGAKVGWDAKKKEITVSMGRLKSSFKIGAKEGVVDGKRIAIDPPSEMMFGSAYIPSRFFSSMMGGGVVWHKETKTLSVSVP
jgi:hypothetical protein